MIVSASDGIKSASPIRHDFDGPQRMACPRTLDHRSSEESRVMDDIDWLIIDVLQRNARVSFKDLGAEVGLSAPAAAERVRRLERRGVILGYRPVLDPNRLGVPILAVIRVNARADAVKTIDEIVLDIPEIIECHRVTGSDSHVIRARLRSTQHLEELLEKLLPFGDTITNIVTSSPVYRRPLSRSVSEPDRR